MANFQNFNFQIVFKVITMLYVTFHFHCTNISLLKFFCCWIHLSNFISNFEKMVVESVGCAGMCLLRISFKIKSLSSFILLFYILFCKYIQFYNWNTSILLIQKDKLNTSFMILKMKSSLDFNIMKNTTKIKLYTCVTFKL